VLERLGKGGMGVVYKVANHSLHGRIEALKLILMSPGAETAGRPESQALGRFQEEIRSHSLVRHANVVQVFVAGTERGYPFFTMQFVDGRSLASLLRERPLGNREAAGLLAKVASAIAYLHGRKIIHRDLKPGNVLLDARGEPFVSDFGLAKAMDAGGDLTESGAMLGSPPYMAPEAARDAAQAKEPCDIYGLGATLYATLTGRPPFQAATPLETVRQVLDDEPVPPRRLNPAVSRDLETICLKCLEKEPSRRFATAGELAGELALVARGLTCRTRPISAPERLVRWARRNPAMAGLAGALTVTVLLAFVTVTALWRQAEGRRRRLQAEDYYSRVELAAAALEANRTDRAERLLAACPPSLRGWEWRLLWRMRHDPPRILAHGPKAGIYGVAFDPSGSPRLAAGGQGIVRIWDGSRGRVEADLPGLPASVRVRGLAWVVDTAGSGRDQIVAACEDGTVRTWDRDPARGAWAVRTFPGGHSSAVTAVTRADRSGRVLSAGDDGRVVLRDGSGHILRVWPEAGPLEPIRAIAADPRGRRFATTGDDGLVRTWSVETGAPEELGELGDSGHGAAFSPDGETLATACGNGAVTLWSLRRRGERTELEGHLDGANAVIFSPDGRLLASAGADGSVKVWDLGTAREAVTLRTGDDHQVEGLAFSPDGERLAGGCTDGSVFVWDARRVPEPRRLQPRDLQGHGRDVVSLDISPDGTQIASAGDDTSVRVWSSAGGVLRHLTYHNSKVNAVRFDPNGRWLASGGRDEVIYLWDLTTPGTIQPLKLSGHMDRIATLAFVPTVPHLLSSGRDPRLLDWDLTRPQARPRILGTAPSEVYALAIDPHGHWFATAGLDATIRLWDYPGARPLESLRVEHKDAITALAISPDGQLLASASYDHTAALWDVAGRRMVHRLRGHTSRVWGVAFHPGGDLLATSGGDRTIKIWETATGRCVATLRGHTSRVYAVAFSPDGGYLASGGADRLVKLWDPSAWQGFRGASR
jgi:WD40 repeat protein